MKSLTITQHTESSKKPIVAELLTKAAIEQNSTRSTPQMRNRVLLWAYPNTQHKRKESDQHAFQIARTAHNLQEEKLTTAQPKPESAEETRTTISKASSTKPPPNLKHGSKLSSVLNSIK